MSVSTAECCSPITCSSPGAPSLRVDRRPSLFRLLRTRPLLNHRIAPSSLKPATPSTTFSLTPGAWKTFCTEDQSFWCCTGTGIEEYSKLTDSIYWHDEDGVYVNLFIPSELTWPERGFRLRQDTRFPAQPRTR